MAGESEVAHSVRIAIADDHALVREGLRRMLSGVNYAEVTDEDLTDELRDKLERVALFEFVGEACNGAEAVKLVQEFEPDVLLLDITMPSMDGIEASTAIRRMNVHTKILILSMHSDEWYVWRTLRAGATGFISKGARLEELLFAIQEVTNGRRYLPDHIAKSFAAEHIRPESDQPLAELLSKREFEVMTYLASGMTNREIAKFLDIRVKTVAVHRAHVLKKLNLKSNRDITRFAIQHGYIEC